MIGFLLLGLPLLAAWKKHENPYWTPFSTLFATPLQLNAALSRVRLTSVPTPAITSALDPGMTSQHVKSVNVTLTSETDPSKIMTEAKNAHALGFTNTSKALQAKANAVGDAKAKGATETDIHQQQLAAQSAQPPSAAVTHAAGWDGFGIEHRRHGEFGDPFHHYREHEFAAPPEGAPWMWGSQPQPQPPMWPHHHHHHEFATQGHGGGGGGAHGGFGGHFGHEFGWGGGGFDVEPVFDPFDPFMVPPPDPTMLAMEGF